MSSDKEFKKRSPEFEVAINIQDFNDLFEQEEMEHGIAE